MSTLSIDELSRTLKHRWGWDSSATHVPADTDSPLLAVDRARRGVAEGQSGRAAVPRWLEPQRGFDRPPGITGLHGKASPSMG